MKFNLTFLCIKPFETWKDLEKNDFEKNSEVQFVNTCIQTLNEHCWVIYI